MARINLTKVAELKEMRLHGLVVNASKEVDAQDCIPTGKVIMAIGSDEDIQKDIDCAADNPQKYSAVTSDVGIEYGEVYCWLLNEQDTICYDERVIRQGHRHGGTHNAQERI